MCASGKIAPVDSSDQDIHYNVSIINNTKDIITLEKLEHNVSQLASELDAIRGSTIKQASSVTQGDAALSDRLGRLENQFVALSNEIHNPVNLYKNCKDDTTSCTIDPDRSHTDYWRDCPTEYLPLQKEVHAHAYRYSTIS
jgi:hypothetical protein